ncbi:MAG: hypothetical protein P1U86_05985 [Verrucomicrobiales bacterium]|nr:hypothetical protein [Verrucomicrobiales bacterium]
MKLPFFLITLFGFFFAIPAAQGDDRPRSATPPILCGVSPKGKDLIGDSPALSKERESLDLLLEALSPIQSRKLETIINQGTLDELIAINGIAEGRAKIIIAGRPYNEVNELMLLKGFGYATVASVILHSSETKP